MCRFWSGPTFAPKSVHFLTAFPAECARLKADPQWRFEGNAFAVFMPDARGACPAGTVPLYRLYNNGDGGVPLHDFVTREIDRTWRIDHGWTPEGAGPGVAGCVPPN